MASEHNFRASQRTYKKKLDEWGLWKNLPLPVAQFIVEKNRQREGKPTDFILFDKPVSLEKVEEAVRRSKVSALATSSDRKAITVLRQIKSNNFSYHENTNRTVVR
ncbi:unnamed protein product [Alternaria alternata]